MQIRHRHHHSVSTSTEVTKSSKFHQPYPLANHAAPGTRHDNTTLQQVFDSPDFWKEYSKSSKSGPNRGLFQNRYLTDPRGFQEFATSSLHKAQRIVTKVLAATSVEQYIDVVKDLDRLSDLLCRVIDLSDFVRATHPDPKIQDAATQAYARLYEYMNVLNTTTGLAEQLNIAISHASKSGAWDEEETMVANILKKDFEKSAIDLPQGERKKFVSLSQEISEIGQEFVDRMAPKERFLSYPSSKLNGLNPLLARQLTKWGQVTLPSIGPSASAALQTVHDEEVRKQIFMSTRSSARENVERLHELLRRRAELAKLSKFTTYAHMTLEDKMARSPESVNTFLVALSKNNKDIISLELAQLMAAKVQTTSCSNASFHPWDKDYYINQIISAARSKLRNKGPLSSYFSLGRVMQGLSTLFSRLYGIRFVPHEALPGETWNSDVRRLDVISESEGHVAVLYCDLFSRPGKSPNPAHFTLRCSRLIRESEIEEAAASANPQFESAVTAANDGMAIATTPSGGVMQLPTIALICDFVPNTSDRPSLLSFSELSTLFHEMGHAIHSILGRTNFQNVSGTRCPTDFAELPSVLMEHFAADPSVLGLFAEHYESGDKLDFSMVEEKLRLHSLFEGCETENQILLALLDQAFHSSLPLDSNFNSSEVYLNVQRKYGALPPDPEGTSWQGFFGHLFGYGSMYYSYLFDRVVAKKIWTTVFDDGASSVDSLRGEHFKQKVLKWGGSRDPWRCLGEVLQDETLLDGGEKAMNLVGSWGIQGRKR
ncbi:Mitochondrial intermediate peptidase [Podosphaera aphanis]|nr:Mitochondrial intermediate peptidase [Podosphaera aphanis]